MSKKKRTKKGNRFGFDYNRRDPEEVRKRRDAPTGGFDHPIKGDFSLFKPREGENRVRILPPTWENPKHYGLELFMHASVGPDENKYLCLQKNGVGPCPVCEAIQEAKRQGMGGDDAIKKMNPFLQTLVWVIDRSDDDPMPKVWFMPRQKIDQEILAHEYDKETGEVEAFDDPEEGKDIVFELKGQGLKRQYSRVRPRAKPSPIAKDDKTARRILKFITENPLTDIINYYEYSYLKGLVSGVVSSSDDVPWGDDDAPKDDRDSDDEDEEDEEDEEESDDGNEDEEDEDEEDEEESDDGNEDEEDEDEEDEVSGRAPPSEGDVVRAQVKGKLRDVTVKKYSAKNPSRVQVETKKGSKVWLDVHDLIDEDDDKDEDEGDIDDPDEDLDDDRPTRGRRGSGRGSRGRSRKKGNRNR